MKKRTLKTVVAVLATLIIMVPAIASPFMAQQAETEVIPLAQENTPTVVQADGTTLYDEEGGGVVPLQAGVPPVIDAEEEKIIPVEDVDVYLVELVASLSAGSTQTGAVGSPVIATINLAAGQPSNIVNAVYKGVQVRVYFGAASKYLDMEAAASNLFDVNYERLGGTIETDPGTGEQYLNYVLGDYNSITKGELKIPLYFKNGITPGGVQITPVAQMYYVGRGSDYQHIAGLDASAGTLTAEAVLSQAGGGVEWYLSNGSNVTAEFNDQSVPVAVQKAVALNGTINVRYNPNLSSALGVLYAKSFNITTTLTLPKGVSFPEDGSGQITSDAGLVWRVAGLDVATDTSGVFSGYNMQKTTSGTDTVYTFTVTYTPAVSGANPTSFVSSVNFTRVMAAPGADTSYVVKAATTATLLGVDDATTATATGAGGAQYTITRKPAVPSEFAYDSDLQNSLSINKLITPTDNASDATGIVGSNGMKAYEDGNTVTFTIGEFEVQNPVKPAEIYELRKFAIYDVVPSNKYLTPSYINFGDVRAADSSYVVPKYIAFTVTVGSSSYTRNYQLTAAQQSARELFIDDALIQSISGFGSYTASQVSGIGLLYYDPSDVAGTAIKSNFTINSPIKLKFIVNAGNPPAPAMGQTLQNEAYLSFVNNPSWGTAKESTAYDYNYSSGRSNAQLQMAGNDLATVEVTKTVKNVTGREGDLSTYMAGDTLQYTITVKNNTYITDRKIKDIEIFDDMMGGYLDTDTISIGVIGHSQNGISVIGSPAWSSTAHDQTDATATENYSKLTSPMTIDGVPNSARVVWKFTGRELSYGQTIKIVYTVKIKTVEQLANDGISIPDPSAGFKIENRVWVNNVIGGGGSSTIVGSLVPRPFIEYGISATINGENAETAGFHTGQQETVKYTVGVKNVENPFEGSSDVKKVVISGILPSGFELNTTNPNFGISRTGRPLASATPVAITVAGAEAAFSYRTNAANEATELYRLVIYKVGRVYQFAFTVNELAGGLLHATEEAFTLVFEAKTTTSISDFTYGAPRLNFETQVRLAIWDDEMGDLNFSGGEPGYRYKYAVPENHKKLNYGYKANSSSWTTLFGSSVKSGLQVAVPILGSINQPSIVTNLAVAKTPNANGYPALNYGPGDGMTYTFAVDNFATFSFKPYNNSIIVAIPKGELLNKTDITVKDNLGNSGGLTTVKDLQDDADYRYYEIGWSENLVATAVLNSGGNYVKGTISVVFKTTIESTYEDTFANDTDATKLVNSKAYFVFSKEMAEETRVYSTNNGGSSQPLDSATYADTDNIDQAALVGGVDPTPFRLGNEYSHSFRRARVYPDVRKVYSKTTGIANKDKMTVTLTVSNASQATAPLKPGYVVEILPKPVMYSSMAAGTTSGIGAPVAQIDATYDFDNANGPQDVTILIWKLPSNINANSSVKIVYNVQIDMVNPSKLPEYGDKYSETIFVPSSEDLSAFRATGTADTEMLNPVSDNIGLAANASAIVAELEGMYTSSAFLSAKAASYYTSLQILGSEVPLIWQETSHSNVLLDQQFSYDLYIQNGSMLEDYCYYQNMVVVDRIPYLSDIGVTDNKNRGTEFRPILQSISISQEIEGFSAAPVPVSQQSYRVWYLLADPSAPITNTPYIRTHDIWKNYWTDKDVAATNLTVAGEEWKLASEVSASELENVIAFRIEFHEGYRLSSLNRMIINVNMQVPDTLKVSLNGTNVFKARNTFAFNAKSSSKVAPTPTGLQGFPLQENADVLLDAPVNNKLIIEKDIEDSNGNNITDKETSRTYEVTVVETNTGTTSTHYLTKGRDGKYRVEIDNLPLGNYVVTETREMLGSGVTITDLYDVRMSSGSSSSNTNSIGFDFDIISIKGNEVGVDIVNRQKEASITIQKTYDRGRVGSGVTFHLRNSYLGVNLTGVTDASGALTFSGMPWGTYDLIEEAPNGYTPSGFTVMSDQSGAPNGYMYYSKKVTLPAFNNSGVATLDSTADIQNASGTGRIVVHKYWNGEPEIGSQAMPRFLLVPYESDDWNSGVWMDYTPGTPTTAATFTSPLVATGRYRLYEVVYAKYEPLHGWSVVQWFYTEPGYDYVLNRYRYDDVLIVQKDVSTEISVNNYFTDIPVPPVTPGSSSSGGRSENPNIPSSSGGAGGGTGGGTGSASGAGAPGSSSAGAPSVSVQGGGILTPSNTGDDNTGSDASRATASLNDNVTPITISPILSNWSAVNMICCIIAAVIAIGNLVSFFTKRKDDEDEEEKGPKVLGVALKVGVIVVGVLVGLLFGTFTDFVRPIGLFDELTKFVVPMFLFQMVLFVSSLVANRQSRFGDDDDNDPVEGYEGYV